MATDSTGIDERLDDALRAVEWREGLAANPEAERKYIEYVRGHSRKLRELKDAAQ